MDMWHRVGNVDWVQTAQLAIPPGHTTHPAAAGVVIGRGRAHQSMATLGVADALAYLLQRELTRPVETDTGVQQADVQVSVNLVATTISLFGERQAVAAGLSRLVAILEGDHEVELPETPFPAPPLQAMDNWRQELQGWFGCNPGSLSSTMNPAWDGSPEVLFDALDALRPTQGTAIVGFTSEPDLFVEISAPERELPQPCPLHWRAAGDRSVRATTPENLLSARTPTGAASIVAAHLLVQALHRTLVAVSGASHEVTGHLTPIDDSTLLLVRAVPSSGGVGDHGSGRAMEDALAAYPALADSVIEQALAQHRAVAQEQIPGVHLAMTRLITGERTVGALRVAEAEALTIAAVREAMASINANILLSVGMDEVPVPSHPLLDPAPVPTDGVDLTSFRSVIPVALATGQLANLEILAGSGVVVSRPRPVTWFDRMFEPQYARTPKGQNKEELPPESTVDLGRLAGRIDQGPVFTLLVDEEGRWLSIPWLALRRPEGLRTLIDAATGPDQLRHTPASDGHERAFRERLRRRRWSIAVFLSVIALLLILGLLLGPGRAKSAPTVTVVPMGQTVTLGNGATLTVSDLEWRTTDVLPHPTALARVEVCGGQVERGGGFNPRNYASDSYFDLGRIDAVTRPGWQPAGETYLRGAELESGQCTQGLISIEAEVAQPVETATIRYTNRLGDDIEWTP
ncbi:MAG TPA: hypothetical protein GXZ60_10560 [Intrasporangiaceae bacterium]|nr:hypothetical protein [Intrasporangiaceae bacterium]